jgi:hypothetical protein
VHVSGTAAVMPEGGDPPTEPYDQARRCLEIIVEALAQATSQGHEKVDQRFTAVLPTQRRGPGISLSWPSLTVGLRSPTAIPEPEPLRELQSISPDSWMEYLIHVMANEVLQKKENAAQ